MTAVLRSASAVLLRRSTACAVLALAVLGHAAHGAGQEAAASTPPAAAKADEKKAPDAKDAKSGEPGFLGQLSLSSSNEPIVVRSDQLEFDYEANRVVYRGTVNVVQGDLAIDCKELLVNLARSGDKDDLQLQEVVAIGDVVITQGERKATGGRAVFDQVKRQITLLENPVLHDGPNEVSGERLVVYLDEGRSVVESSPKKRVSAILYPGKGDKVDLAAQPKATGDGATQPKPAAPGARR